MKINQIVQETTTSGSVAPVEHGFVKMQTRSPSVYGNTKAGSLFKGKKTKAPYANSINEGAEISEAQLEEDDIILVPGQGRKMKTGFVPHGQSRVDHEVEMARSDLLSAAKNAEAIFNLIETTSEDEGLQGWVQEKIIKANDYLNSVREYLEGKQVQGVAEGLPQTLRKVVPGYAKREIDRKMDAGKFGKTDADKDANFQRYKKIQDKLKEQGVAEGLRGTGNPGMPTPYDQGRADAKKGRPYDNPYDQPGEEQEHRNYRKGYEQGKEQGVAEDDAGDVEQRMIAKIEKEKQRLAKLKQTDPEAYKREMEKRKTSSRVPPVSTFEDQGVAEADKHSFVGKIQRGHELKKKVDSTFKDIGNAQKKGDKEAGSKAFRKHERYANLERPGTWTKSKDQGVTEGAKVDRMVKHVAQSEKKLGHSKKEAENIAWATANKRGMLDNKNKKK